jgi:hypothetical protein
MRSWIAVGVGGLLLVAGARVSASPGGGVDYQVSEKGQLDGDGSAAKPFRRITDAVAKARSDRASGAIAAGEEIRIHVAAGHYMGAYAKGGDAHAEPEFEMLPIILNVPHLRLLGATDLTPDGAGLPVGIKAGTETTIETKEPLPEQGVLILVTRTTEGSVGDDVTVSGFVLDGHGGMGGSQTILFDRVSGFLLARNVMTGANGGSGARLSSGRIEGNLVQGNDDLGIGVGGGSDVFPADVVVQGNRVTKNRFQGLAISVVPRYLDVPLGGNTLAPPPLDDKFDAANPQDRRKIPNHLKLQVLGNDVSDNKSGGMRYLVDSPSHYQPKDPAQPITASMELTVTDNTISGNGDYGLIFDAGFPTLDVAKNPWPMQATFTIALKKNRVTGNGRARAFFCFTRAYVWIGQDSLRDNKYLSQSRFEAQAANGELDEFDYDHPAEYQGVALGNTLVVNGKTIPNGHTITKP